MTHTIQMKLVKDSLQEPIGVEDEQNYEPVSTEEADVQCDFYGEE